MLIRQWLSAGLILLALTLSTRVLAHADSDYTHALATAPRGILLNKTDTIMTLGTAGMNTATVVDTTNPVAPDTQAVSLTNGANQFGSIWSKTDNYFDLNKDETVSMWLYLGDKGDNGGGGMAFVLQNDARGLAASPTFERYGPLAETLGVWGVDKNPSQQQNRALAATAIQNSWALEFDTETNNKTGEHAPGQANSFDIGYSGNHIASAYPGEAVTYHQYVDKDYWGGIIPHDKYYYGLKHNGLIANTTDPGFLSNGQWHHVTIQWNAAAETISYAFNDRDPQTDDRQEGIHQTVRLDPRLLDPGSQHKGRVRWGLTSAAGNKWHHNLVVFENTPGTIDAETKTTLTDLTLKREIKDQGETVANNRVRLDYHLNYRDGRQPWSSIVADLKLPKFIEFEEAEITYSGDRQPETLDVKDISNQQLRTELGYAMDSAYPEATIRLTGRVASVAKTTEVARESSIFSSNALVRTLETPAFSINPSVDLDLAVTSGQTVALNPQEGTTIRGKVTVTTLAARPTVKVSPTLNGVGLPAISPRDDGTFDLPISPAKLRAGTNTLTFRALTADGSESNLVTVTIHVRGELKLSSVSTNEQFEASTLTGRSQLVHREGDWQLVVQDTRGRGSQWTLMVQATPFVARHGATLNGGPLYVTPDGITPIGATPTAIMTHTMAETRDGKFDVAAQWSHQTGVLLGVEKGTAAGEYTGQLTWTLEDAPQ
ncbi:MULTISPECIES: WxL domain-containing protein [Lactobacillaceae]|uniref:WxL domain-containing protein n=1 Tax=Lactobacillaceae TaxID=33958 RepID=UPI0014572A5B|nr:WxL domain-containing protein [Lactobacillus sp. HBUAS51381]NLR10602.1 hypothetical protein [Lactobacillus sp. HBUAS51381]